ncbi:bifunctional DNA-binding transcriptional regulator/antitoxin component of YhaV-PrlF toxin-antitoxin module [Actinoplanes tereljensis]|uniref:AbrB/MazE/SpoVT family DNA-binding domain-containing protein n=1 Tax=Paractinoplanes tereljensis TaxID=571912 RepID=UPI001EF16BE8|nr:AbrB/MazE/SpoVT family DNA-binding domain-containing protein [Actinoplanes tereljensis]
MDRSGRLIAVEILAALGWRPGVRLDARARAGLVLVTADEQGTFVLRRRDELRLPATVRHWSGLTTGCRVLLVAEPESERLVIHPPAALGAMLREFHQEKLGGDAT